ncbi:antibiotic biosynthesis monooxygenase family protein [Ralstonia flatus]|uniref:antibiotic biosynthesis monooxygenase family protein n=1 Tax=Ralstonia flatus TaxID=3058601 RepID=UPI002930977C|nr:antibiotic biosynthesis monooxygenase family protein [Ralstonia sp. LMG 32965]
MTSTLLEILEYDGISWPFLMTRFRMTSVQASDNSHTAVFRISRFAVPPAAMPAFMERIQQARNLLAAQPGCLKSSVLTHPAGTAEFNVVSIVEWASLQAMETAKSAIEAQQVQEGFDPETFRRDLGISADTAVYTAATR